MRNRLFKRISVALLSATLCFGALPTGRYMEQVHAEPQSKTVCDLICDSSVSDAEIVELQKARLCGLVPDALAGDVNRAITVPEYKLLIKNLYDYEKENVPDNAQGWFNGDETGTVTRKEAADLFLSNYVYMVSEFSLNNIAEARGTLFGTLMECQDPIILMGQKIILKRKY